MWFASRLAVVLEEADESESWLDLCEAKGRGPAATVRTLRQEAGELTAIFSKARATATRNLKRPGVT